MGLFLAFMSFDMLGALIFSALRILLKAKIPLIAKTQKWGFVIDVTENGAVLCHVDDLKEGGTKGFF